MKYLNILFILFLFPLFLSAQETETPSFTSDVKLKITNRHYWRGIPVSSAPSFEGSLSVSKGGFTIGYWGGYGFDNTYSEFDLYGSYQIGNFTFSFIDLYVIRSENSLRDYHPEQRYGDFNRETTTHNIDLTAAYKISDDFPLSVAFSTMVWGNDRDENGDQRYSTYFRLGYPLALNDQTNLDFFMGMTLNNEPSAYGDSAGVVNTGVSGTQLLKITDNFSLPITATIAINPQRETGFLIFAIGW